MKTSSIKTKQRLLSILSKKIDLDLFYSVSLAKHNINLQGYMNSTTIYKLKELGYDLKWNDRVGFLEGRKGCVDVCLTIKSW